MELDADLKALHAAYALGRETGRLESGIGAVEFERTTEILTRFLPSAPAVIADIGGGPGKYALWLANRGYSVEHRDIMPIHIEALQQQPHPNVVAKIGDAREIDLPDCSVDAVLLLGPLYHLRARADRMQAIGESRRIVRAGGTVFVVAISRWAPRMDGVLLKRAYSPFRQIVSECESAGFFPPAKPGNFFAYCHRPEELTREVTDAGLEQQHLLSIEGISFALQDIEQRMEDPIDREVVLETARALESVPELLGVGPHIMSVSIRPS